MIMLDDRIYNRNIAETQSFYTGLFNFDSVDLPLFEKFTKLFQGDYPLYEVIKSGQRIALAQQNQDSHFANGTSAVVTEAPKLVNLAHDALRKKHPKAQVSIILNMRSLIQNNVFILNNKFNSE